MDAYWKGKAKMTQTILTVDDNEQVHEVLEPMLELWLDERETTMDIVKLANGAEALSWIKNKGQPFMILLDVRMPVMGGGEFIRQVASLGHDIRPYTLLLTGYADDLEEHLGSDALLMDHLRKPFKVEELFHALDKLENSMNN